jgi:hypothetical protein
MGSTWVSLLPGASTLIISINPDFIEDAGKGKWFFYLAIPGDCRAATDTLDFITPAEHLDVFMEAAREYGRLPLRF